MNPDDGDGGDDGYRTVLQHIQRAIFEQFGERLVLIMSDYKPFLFVRWRNPEPIGAPFPITVLIIAEDDYDYITVSLMHDGWNLPSDPAAARFLLGYVNTYTPFYYADPDFFLQVVNFVREIFVAFGVTPLPDGGGDDGGSTQK